MVIHVVTVDLNAPGVGILVTPGRPGEDLPLEARTTSGFLSEFGLQVAVNGDYFSPFRSRSVTDRYPREGDPVRPHGTAASRGVLYWEERPKSPTLYVSERLEAGFERPDGELYNALSGSPMLVADGEPIAYPGAAPEPRTAVGLDRERRRLILVVVDGRQERYSEGATWDEIAGILVGHGAHWGMNLDGGGSSALVVEGPGGRPEVLSSPIDCGVPGRERPVANHLGVRAEPLAGR
jgi:exopolysaccharide biosynthesis protein